ncbi:hypothetical protein PHYPSEUDO_010297 [Phytophthora pseudosyringae]|uniref:Elicitin n=1 Tax=Phytophthora pseudosyringae TaxID=221518 RepID=A0A8T1VDE0_9STRA|nr:hypothetical protein PHYPSEUDO_010297 [Phytophthora pseudosyringae]
MVPWLTSTVVINLTLICVVVADDVCITSELLGIAGSPHVARCSADAGFSSIATISELSPEQIRVICATSACSALIKEMAAMGLGDCRIPETKIYLRTDIIDAYTERCNTIDSSSSSDGSVSTDNLSSSATNSATTVVVRYISTVTLALATLLA